MRVTNFNSVWRKDPLFQSWLLPDPISKHNFRCKVCQCTLELGNMGKGALVKHTKSAKHVKNSEELNSASAGILASWARPASSTSSTSSNKSVAGSTSETIVVQDDSTPSTSNPLGNWAIADDVLRAEIFSTMNHAVNHHSYNSSKHSSVLFETMFPDSKIAKQFACRPSKMAYMTSFGLAPYFSEILIKQLSEVQFYSINFDESYNCVVKKEQLDVLVRYYDVERSKVVDRYLCSKFLGHTLVLTYPISFYPQ